MDELWALTKHSINSDLNVPLNTLMSNLTEDEKKLINNVISSLGNSTYGLSALKSVLNTINGNSNAAYFAAAGTSKTILNTSGGRIGDGDGAITLASFISPIPGYLTFSATG